MFEDKDVHMLKKILWEPLFFIFFLASGLVPVKFKSMNKISVNLVVYMTLARNLVCQGVYINVVMQHEYV